MSAERPYALPPLPVLGLSLGLPLVLWAAASAVRLWMPEGSEYLGIFRYDLFYYLANAREVLETGNGLFYDNPFSASFDGPRVYSHLQLVIFGWLWWLFGVPLPLLWEIFQVVFGAGMFLVLWRLLGTFFGERRERIAAFVLLAIGGGGLAIQSAVFAAGSTSSFMEVFRFFAAGTKGPAWLPNVYQNALYTTEAWYHLLAFGTLSCVARAQRKAATIGVLLTWWSHPFTGLELGAIVGAFAVVEAWLARSRETIVFAAAIAIVSVPFLVYYIVLIPAWSIEAAYVLENWRVDITLFHFREAWSMWGFFLLGPFFLLRPSLGIVDLAGSRSDRLLVVWFVVVTVLVLHDVFLPPGVDAFQPLHFTRGYLFVPMGIMLFRATLSLSKGWPARRRRLAFVSLLAVVCLDNVVHTIELVDPADRPVLDADVIAVMRFLDSQSPPTNVLVDGAVPLMAGTLPVVTSHRVYLAHHFLTPFFPEKSAAVERLIASESPAPEAARLGIGFVVGRAAIEAAFERDLERSRARRAFASGPYVVIEVLLPKRPQAPGPPPPS